MKTPTETIATERIPLPSPLPKPFRESMGDEVADAFAEWMEIGRLPYIVSRRGYYPSTVDIPMPKIVREKLGDEAADAYIEWMDTEVMPYLLALQEPDTSHTTSADASD